MAEFAITVAQRVNTRKLAKSDDRQFNPRGVYQYRAPSEERALETFHKEVPIAHLEDFEVKVTRLTPH
jgi:hypothetical protein